MTSAGKLETERGDSLAKQATLALMGIAAIAMIVLINVQGRPLQAPVPHTVGDCSDCGIVVAVRRSAHSAPVFFVEVQMVDGSLRTVQQLAAGFSVGDLVQLNGNILTLRPA